MPTSRNRKKRNNKVANSQRNNRINRNDVFEIFYFRNFKVVAHFLFSGTTQQVKKCIENGDISNHWFEDYDDIVVIDNNNEFFNIVLASDDDDESLEIFKTEIENEMYKIQSNEVKRTCYTFTNERFGLIADTQTKNEYYICDLEMCGCCGIFQVNGHSRIKFTKIELNEFIKSYNEKLFVISEIKDELLWTVKMSNVFKHCEIEMEIEDKVLEYLEAKEVL